MKFPVSIEKFISEQEQLNGENLLHSSRSLCEKFLEAANEVYHRTLRGEIDENPFTGDIAEDMRRIWKEHGTEEPKDSGAMFGVLEVLKDWCSEAFEQAIEDRAEGVAG